MTEESLTTDGSAPRPSGGGLAGVIAPEGVAALLAIVVVVVVLLAGRLTGSSGTAAIATPSPSQTPTPTATPGPGVDIQAIHSLIDVNEALLFQKTVIAAQIAAKQVDPSILQPSFRTILNELSATGDDAARRLASSPGGADVGQKIRILYGTLREQTVQAVALSPNDSSAKNLAAWKASAVAISKTLDSIPGLDDRLNALLAAAAVLPSPSPSSSPSAEVSPSASPSAIPSASIAVVTPPATPSPATPVPSPSVAPSSSLGPAPSLGPNLIADGSFDTGVGTPWQLVLSDQAANASVSADPVDPHSPTAAARIDIAAPSNRQLGIALQQPGLRVEAGAYYHVSIALRSSEVRDVRIRLADGANGQILDSRVFTIGASWSVAAFDFSSFVGSGSAVFSVDVGRSDRTVWVDDVTLARIPPG